MFTGFSVFYGLILIYLYRNEADISNHNSFDITFIARADFFPVSLDQERQGHKRYAGGRKYCKSSSLCCNYAYPGKDDPNACPQTKRFIVSGRQATVAVF